ncbi:hypothetical protein, partial [Helicobacter sp. CLO-3]|uniref:hypothetical protein n=1 Tax=Helicobacter sp. CLO-3 TaxID=211 RepID=UPI00155FE419
DMGSAAQLLSLVLVAIVWDFYRRARGLACVLSSFAVLGLFGLLNRLWVLKLAWVQIDSAIKSQR